MPVPLGGRESMGWERQANLLTRRQATAGKAARVATKAALVASRRYRGLRDPLGRKHSRWLCKTFLAGSALGQSVAAVQWQRFQSLIAQDSGSFPWVYPIVKGRLASLLNDKIGRGFGRQ